ncbi:MAG: AraC family transcriptional regulator [Kiritimatiellia bacterium]
MRKWPFRVRSLGYSNYEPGYKGFPLGDHPVDHRYTWEKGRVLSTLTLVFVSRGEGCFRSGPSGELPIKANTVICVFPEIRHAYCPDVETGWHSQWVELDTRDALPLIRQAGITEDSPLRTFDATPRLARLYQQLYDCSREESYGVQQELAAGAYSILVHVIALWRSKAPCARHFAVVERMRQYLTNDLMKTPSVEEAAVQAGLSVSRLRVLFKQATGLSPKQFQLEARMHRAETLLMESSLPVGAIAEQTGFESIYHFSRQFKRMRGVSPVKFRIVRESVWNSSDMRYQG